ncbi:MAG: hypothetical protein GY865_20105 [candidate division Zixibacteria bacterium]|nr:hypothetical protein [candidate division Zixibacteria bacterium]
MDKKAFLLGFFSVGGQVLLLRELIADFNGDELFIGTALFGLMIAVALGSYLGGGEKKPIKTNLLFILGAVLLPLSIIAIRLSPVWFHFTIGEVVPFGLAALISIALTFPTGFISGILFSSVSREGFRPSASINSVYLFEGLGAFIGGIAITTLVGPVFSNLGMALGLGVIVVLFGLIPLHGRLVYITAIISFLLLIGIKFTTPVLDIVLSEVKYHPYKIENLFETHYGFQSLLSRDDTFVLLTDNKIEANYPDIETIENILIPPLIYKPEAKNILVIGRTEFGISQLSDIFPEITITSIDPRQSLGIALNKKIKSNQNVNFIIDDPLTYFNNMDIITKYDIIIILAGRPDNYKTGRYYSERFLRLSKRILTPEGILYIPTSYDTDRFISKQKKDILSTIYSTTKYSYKYVNIWPGTSTLFFMSNEPLFDLSYESIINRINNITETACIEYKPQFINENYLKDRLGQSKILNLYNTLDSSVEINNLKYPKLIYEQLLLNSKLNKTDSVITNFIFKTIYPSLIIIFIITLMFTVFVFGHKKINKRRKFGLFLYFTAGLTTLTAELITFYVYQSSAGSLYSEIGLLIGTFMFGLSLGTYIAIKSKTERLEYPSLFLLLTSMLLFKFTYLQIPPAILIYYHLLFLFTVALAGGGLFVAATYRYYYGRPGVNRGTGYAFEITGSAIGALFTITILLPLIGLQWLISSVIILLFVCFIGAYITE